MGNIFYEAFGQCLVEIGCLFSAVLRITSGARGHTQRSYIQSKQSNPLRQLPGPGKQYIISGTEEEGVYLHMWTPPGYHHKGQATNTVHKKPPLTIQLEERHFPTINYNVTQLEAYVITGTHQ